MNYCVTGCAGFIGQKVAEKLLEQGDTVVGVDNMNDYYDPRLKEWRLSVLRKFERFTFHKQDIENYEALEELFSTYSFDAVFNLAARAGVRSSVENPWIYYDTNVKGTLNLLECARKYHVQKFLLASSSSVYGENTIPYSEGDNTDRALSPYAASKKSAEALCYTYHYLYGLDVTVYRYFTVYGPAGRPDMATFRFIRNIDEGKAIDVYGDGKQKRDWTYIDDIAVGTVLGIKLSGYNTINLGNNTPVELMEIIKLIESEIGKKAKINYLTKHQADVFATWADISRGNSLLGWQPEIGYAEGITRTVEWYKNNKSWIKQLSG